MPIHLRFVRFTFSFNQIQRLTHQTDPYHHNEHVSGNGLSRIIGTSIYFKKAVFEILVVQAHKKKPGDETLQKDWNP